jgi:hypothetical protein
VKGYRFSASTVLALVVLVVTLEVPGFAQEDMLGIPYYYVVKTESPDDFLSLRTEPSRGGLYIMSISNETLLEVVERRPNRWWYVRVLPFGQEGWVLSGEGNERWITCCRTFAVDAVPIPVVNETVGFKTPSYSIYCVLEDSWLRCDMKQISGPLPARPRDCSFQWGDAFVIEPSGLGYRLCHGDTVANDALPTLSYGMTWERGGLTCKLDKTVLTCMNGAKHGFSLSKDSQKIF